MSGWFASWKSHRALLRATRVGQRVQLCGPLAVEAFGEITIDDDVRLGGPAAMMHLVAARGASIHIGATSVISHGCGLSATSSIVVGRGVTIGPFCLLLDSDFHTVGDHSTGSEALPIVIEDNAYIEANVVVLRGARIGAGARVRAGSVVSGIVPAGATVSGVPARAVHDMTNDMNDSNDDGDRDLTDDVCALIANVFGLSSPPDADALLESLAGWDSLGTLNLLLSLEERCGVNIITEDFLQLRSVRDVVTAVSTLARNVEDSPAEAHW